MGITRAPEQSMMTSGWERSETVLCPKRFHGIRHSYEKCESPGMQITSRKGGLAQLLPCCRTNGPRDCRDICPFHLETHSWNPACGVSEAGTHSIGGPTASPCTYPCTQVISFAFSFGKAEALRTKVR